MSLSGSQLTCKVGYQMSLSGKNPRKTRKWVGLLVQAPTRIIIFFLEMFFFCVLSFVFLDYMFSTCVGYGQYEFLVYSIMCLLCRVGAKYIGTCTCLYLSTFFRVLACTLYLSFKNVLVFVLVPKYITKYLVLEDKYIASTSCFVPKKYIL